TARYWPAPVSRMWPRRRRPLQTETLETIAASAYSVSLSLPGLPCDLALALVTPGLRISGSGGCIASLPAGHRLRELACWKRSARIGKPDLEHAVVAFENLMMRAITNRVRSGFAVGDQR